jgi:hypothetical protein
MALPFACTKRRIFVSAAILLFAHTVSSPALADTITDPINDFIPSFTGTHDPSLDVISFSATFDGATFHLTGVENGPIAGFSTGLFVIGFNRGLGASNFSVIGHGGVTFDSVVTMTSAGVLGGNILNLASVTDTISGNMFTINVPLASVPPLNGASPSSFLVNLWPRDISQAGNAAIADFAPDNSDLSVPEPLSVSLFAAGLLGLTFMRGRKTKTAKAA